MKEIKKPIDQELLNSNKKNQSIKDKPVVSEQLKSDQITDDATDLYIQLEESKKLVDEQRNQILRAYAEIENMRRRHQEEITKARKFSIETFSEDLISVKDSLEAAINQENQTIETMQDGVNAINKQLSSAFDRNHIQEIKPVKGDKFDPCLHQAISSVPNEEEAENSVVKLLQKGYMIWDRTLRPAIVIISSGQTKLKE